MSDFNKVIISCRLGKEVELKYSQSGKAVANFDVAVNDGYGDNRKTFWFRIVVWDKLAEACANSLKKGSRCLVEGKLTERQYETQDGTKKRVTEIIASSVQFLDRKSEEQP